MKTSSVVFLYEGKPLPLYPTMEEDLFCCILQWRKPMEKCCCVVSHNGKKLNINNNAKINFVGKYYFYPWISFPCGTVLLNKLQVKNLVVLSL
jgi:hypothetical protein